jgi:hypothetical protein
MATRKAAARHVCCGHQSQNSRHVPAARADCARARNSAPPIVTRVTARGIVNPPGAEIPFTTVRCEVEGHQRRPIRSSGGSMHIQWHYNEWLSAANRYRARSGASTPLQHSTEQHNTAHPVTPLQYAERHTHALVHVQWSPSNPMIRFATTSSSAWAPVIFMGNTVSKGVDGKVLVMNLCSRALLH